MRRISILFLAAFLLVGCRSIPQIVTASTIIETQTDAAIETASVSTLADSTVQDAEHLLEAAKETGNIDLVYIAEKHVAEVKKIADKSKVIQSIQKDERAATVDHLEIDSKAATVAAEIKESAAVSERTVSMLIGFAVVLILAALILLYVKFRKSIKKLFPFMP
jgi:hypothetical protein